ncbi:MAG TPA: molybdopterin cofactor-binding domain-containing protein [Verrucomicrobiae bacterium]|nr:molybdopterin cofactor-binding domain-containing protein [Verrucomicrobiae bacterium]
MNQPTKKAGDSQLARPITRRCFVKIGGALFVSLAVAPEFSFAAAASGDSLDPSLLASWLEIRHDDTILMRTGRTETGTGMTAYYAQAIAEELRVRPEAVTLVLGDTDRTPDGGFSAGFLNGMYNVRKVAAYTREAILKLSATRLGVPASRLTISDGIISGGGKTISYGRLVQGQHLDLTIPVSGKLPKIDADEWNGLADLEGFKVTGNPPLTPASKCKVIGTSYPVPGIPGKITGKTKWSCDVRLPGMLHARMVRPATLGSTLVSVGKLDQQQFPTAQVVRKANLVAVVSPDEWEATRAAVAVAAGTKWTDWSGLPGSENVTKTLRARDWGKPSETRQDGPSAAATLANAARKISATYELPYVRHAPIGPFVAVADVRRDGSVTVWTHSAQSQGLRVQIAHTLGVPRDKVVVRWLDHSGQYGRTTFGGDGAEADAAILSHLLGKPVRVQWSLEEDLAWSSVSPAWVIDAAGGLDANGHLTSFHWSSYSPHESDARLLGAVLAGMPCTNSLPGGWVATEWVYNKIDSRLEEAYGMPNLAAESAYGGLRGNIMRTPGQRQQNFAIECLMNEAAAAVQMDPVRFRLNHTSDQRLIEIINATAKAAGWESRPSPHPQARKIGTEPVTGRGVCIMRRENAYWAGIAEISLVPDTGAMQVTKFTVGCEPGKIINPRQLGLCMKSGVVMGLSEGLKEEITFDSRKVTSTDWNGYPILTMAETPEIDVVQISRDDHGFGGGSEGANAVVPAALVAAIFDATGVQPRRLPLKPEYIRSLLKA